MIVHFLWLLKNSSNSQKGGYVVYEDSLLELKKKWVAPLQSSAVKQWGRREKCAWMETSIPWAPTFALLFKILPIYLAHPSFHSPLFPSIESGHILPLPLGLGSYCVFFVIGVFFVFVFFAHCALYWICYCAQEMHWPRWKEIFNQSH